MIEKIEFKLDEDGQAINAYRDGTESEFYELRTWRGARDLVDTLNGYAEANRVLREKLLKAEGWGCITGVTGK